ncbi:MAG TPA: hypothetical protein PK402_02450, partial [Tepidisphaeraceae bacterium]|nr:hypothetical protein [Tepidisphaeraceae bacterium]
AKIKLPNEAGRYRIYAYAYDQAGNGAVGTVPVLAGEYVKNTPAPAAPPVVKDKAPVAPPVVKTETKKADEHLIQTKNPSW